MHSPELQVVHIVRYTQPVPTTIIESQVTSSFIYCSITFPACAHLTYAPRPIVVVHTSSSAPNRPQQDRCPGSGLMTATMATVLVPKSKRVRFLPVSLTALFTFTVLLENSFALAVIFDVTAMVTSPLHFPVAVPATVGQHQAVWCWVYSASQLRPPSTLRGRGEGIHKPYSMSFSRCQLCHRWLTILEPA